MSEFAWIAQEQALSAASLTVLAQTVSPNDNGQLVHDVFFPRQDVNSTKLRDVRNVSFRPATERREWNGRGRVIETKTPNYNELQFIPVEGYFKIGEKEMQDLFEATFGNQQAFRDMVRVTVPQRTEDLALANLRRLEIDAFQSWLAGTIQVKNPDSDLSAGDQVTISYNFDTTRYQSAMTAWSNSGVNAYDLFLQWVQDGLDRMPGAVGVTMRRATFRAIQNDAPKGLNNITLTAAQVRDQFQQDLGIPFTFVINERTVDEYTDSGLVTATKYIHLAQKVALIPPGNRVGNMCYAPVVRAGNLSASVPEARIDIRGQTAFIEPAGNGREMTTEVQVNAFPVPIETSIWVIDAGV